MHFLLVDLVTGSKQERVRTLDGGFRPPAETSLPDCRVSAGACLTNKAEKLIIKAVIVITNLQQLQLGCEEAQRGRNARRLRVGEIHALRSVGTSVLTDMTC